MAEDVRMQTKGERQKSMYQRHTDSGFVRVETQHNSRGVAFNDMVALEAQRPVAHIRKKGRNDRG